MPVFDWSTTAGDNDNSDSNINWAEGQAPSTVNDSARALMAQVAYKLNFETANVTNGGASNAYTYTTGQTLSAYADNMRFAWSPNGDSTGSVTLNVDSIGAKKVYMPDGTQAGNGDLDADSIYDVVYDSALDTASGGFKIVGFADKAANYQPVDATLTAFAGISFSADEIAYATGADTFSTTSLTAFARTILDDANASAARTTLGVAIGSDVQAWDADLDTYAANPLTSAELGELQNIGTTTISAAQWGYLGGTDQALATTDAVEFSTILAPAPFSSETSGTLTAASANKIVAMSGDVTLNNSVFSAGDMIFFYNTGVSNRTITKGTLTNLFLGGDGDNGSRTIGPRGMAMVYFNTASTASCSGNVS